MFVFTEQVPCLAPLIVHPRQGLIALQCFLRTLNSLYCSIEPLDGLLQVALFHHNRAAQPVPSHDRPGSPILRAFGILSQDGLVSSKRLFEPPRFEQESGAEIQESHSFRLQPDGLVQVAQGVLVFAQQVPGERTIVVQTCRSVYALLGLIGLLNDLQRGIILPNCLPVVAILLSNLPSQPMPIHDRHITPFPSLHARLAESRLVLGRSLLQSSQLPQKSGTEELELSVVRFEPDGLIDGSKGRVRFVQVISRGSQRLMSQRLIRAFRQKPFGIGERCPKIPQTTLGTTTFVVQPRVFRVESQHLGQVGDCQLALTESVGGVRPPAVGIRFFRRQGDCLIRIFQRLGVVA